MPYSTVDLVAAEFRSLEISATTAVTITEVEGFITEYDALIDAFVGSRYALPIVSVPALAILQMISRRLAACRVAKILAIKNVEVKAANQDVGGCSEKEMMDLLAKIKSGALPLQDAALTTSGLFMSSGNTDNGVEQFFKRDGDQW